MSAVGLFSRKCDGQAQMQPAHMPTGLDDDQGFWLLVPHEATRGPDGQSRRVVGIISRSDLLKPADTHAADDLLREGPFRGRVRSQ